MGGRRSRADAGRAVTAPIAIMDDMRPVAELTALGSVFFLAGVVGLPLLIANGIFYWAAWALLTIFLVIGGGLVAVTVPRFLRRATPFLVIMPEGFLCPGLAEPLVPWARVDYAVVAGFNGSVTTNLYFKRHARLPARDGSRFNVRVHRRRRLLTIGGPSPRGMSLEEYGACIAEHVEPQHP